MKGSKALKMRSKTGVQHEQNKSYKEFDKNQIQRSESFFWQKGINTSKISSALHIRLELGSHSSSVLSSVRQQACSWKAFL